MTKQEAGNERQAAYCRVRDALRGHKGRFTKTEALRIIHEMSNGDTDWKGVEASLELLGIPEGDPYAGVGEAYLKEQRKPG